MRRTEIVQRLTDILKDLESCKLDSKVADFILKSLENWGMSPPAVDSESRQAIMQVYYMGYTFNQWDEELEKDTKVMEAKNKRYLAAKKRLRSDV